jgi:serine/threonine protein kinase
MLAGLVRDRYELGERLGGGGQGDVFKAYDHQHERPVAIKVRRWASEEERRTLLREAKMLLTLTPHPGLPLVRDDFFDGDRYYIVMEWVEGVTLDHVREERGDRLPLDEVAGYVRQVAGALQHLHGHDPPIVHRDVKPGNIVRAHDGRVVLVDFGLSGPGGTGGASGGTSGYGAPELVSGGPVTPAADVFGLAATAFSLLTGRPPNGLPPDWKTMCGEAAPRVEGAIRAALSIDPARRPAGALEFAEHLAPAPVEPPSAATEESLRAPVPAPGKPLTTRRRRGRVWVAAAVSGLVAATVGAVLLLQPAPAADPPHDRGIGLVIGGFPGDPMDTGAREALGQAEREFDVGGVAVNPGGSADYQGELLRLARQGYDPVIGLTEVFDLYGPALSRYPDTTFVLLTGSGPSPGPTPPNVVALEFRTDEAGYLAGYLAGLVVPRSEGRTVVGAVTPAAVPEIERYVSGFRAGARAASPGATLLHEFSGDFGDPRACRRAAQHEISRGVQAVFVVAGPCSAGALEAAQEAGVWSINAVTDQPGEGILTSAVKDFSKAVEVAIRRVERDDLPADGVISVGLAEGAVGLGTINPKVDPEVVRQVRREEQGLRSGEHQDLETSPTSS